MDSPKMCVFWVLKNGLPIYAGPHLRDFWKRFFFQKNHARIQVFFFFKRFFFWDEKICPEIFFQTRFFFVAAGGLNGFDVVDQMVGLVSTYGAHSQWEGYLHAGAVGSKGDRFFFLRKFVMKKQLGGVMLCDVWGVLTSEIFNNSTFSTQDRSCCQSLWVESRYSICTWDIFK